MVMPSTAVKSRFPIDAGEGNQSVVNVSNDIQGRERFREVLLPLVNSVTMA